MKVFEHGINAQQDEWLGALKVIADTDLPIYAGFSTSIVDFDGHSLNESAMGLARVNGPHAMANYFEETDMKYCNRAVLYHMNRLVDLYSDVTQHFERTCPLGTAIRGNFESPKIFFELGAFFGASRRVYESIRKVLWKHLGKNRKGRWKSFHSALKDEKLFPSGLLFRLRESWSEFGIKLSAYGDCIMHNDPVNDGQTTCWLNWYGSRWGASVWLPSNPEQKSRRSFKFRDGPEALSYCHAIASHLVALCAEIESLDCVRDHLNNPSMIIPSDDEDRPAAPQP